MILRPLGKVYTSDEAYSITQEELSWLMHGLRVEEIKRYEAMKRKFPPYKLLKMLNIFLGEKPVFTCFFLTF